MFIIFDKILLLLLASTCFSLPVKSQTKATAGWKNKQADICILLDCSSSVWKVDYGRLKNHTADLIGDMDIGPSATRVAIGVYSENYSQYVAINNNLSKENLQITTRNAPYLKGNGYLSRALKGLREQCFGHGLARPHVPMIALLYTDGESRYKQLTADNATLVKNDGIFLFTIGISPQVDREELRLISSDPKATFSHYVPDFYSLAGLRSKLSTSMSEVELFQGIEGTCGEKTKVDTVFVFDETAIGQNDTKKIKAFIKAVVDNLSVNSGNARVGIVSKTCHEGDIVLGQYVTKEGFAAGLDENVGPEISELFKRSRINSFLPENGARADAKSRIVLILQTNVEIKSDLESEAHRARYDGIEIFVVNLGNDYNKDFVYGLTSNPENVMFVNSADDLKTPKAKQEFDSIFCKDL
jgi:hypothetical protein